MHRWIIIIIAGLALGGCMTLGEDYQRPDPEYDIPQTYDQARAARTGAYIPQDRWWTIFRNPDLDRIVTNVALKNPDIHQAAARVMEARAQMRQTQADQYPELNLNAQASRQQQSISSLNGDRESFISETKSLSLPASFELDLWGRLSRATEATRADILSAEENRRTVVQSLIAETVTRFLEVRYLEQQISITRRLIESHRLNLELVDSRYQRGLTSILDVRQARRILAQAESRLPSVVQALGQTRQALAILQGAYPVANEPDAYKAQAFQSLPPVPVGLPSELLNRRPDVLAAEARLMSANARVGAAKASRLPIISLTGTLGYASDSLKDLFTPQSQLWQVAPQGLQPVFNAGKLSAAQRAAEARYQQQLADYSKTVLNAFAEVEGALLTRQQQIERREMIIRFHAEAEATLVIALDRYQRGLVDYINVLDARQALFQAELDMVESELAIYTNRVRLHRALGGGWDNIVAAVEEPEAGISGMLKRSREIVK